MKFTINGSATNSLIPIQRPTPVWLKVIAYVEALPDGDLVTATELSFRLGHDPSFIRKMALRFDREEKYFVHVERFTYWGNPKTIAEAKKHYANETVGSQEDE